MKRILLIVITPLLLSLGLRAQEAKDSTAVYDVFDQLSQSITVNQSPEIHSAMSAHVDKNARKAASGQADQTFRIRIFFDSGQNARAASEAAAARFRSLHPGVAVTRSFSNPFFKVTVGNYSTKADAANALKSIQQEFPTAFIVRN
ncbi:MAG: SPOR domain-containing protein [Bacteroidales bacterium]|nr:SPOR domain-containing protein [Bacteroidales bacterium]